MEYHSVSNTVTVACNLPHGMICELGLELDYNLQRFVQTPKYKRVVLRGATRAAMLALPPGVQYTARRDLSPGTTEGVDREFIEQWLKEHPRHVRHIWIVESPKDVKHQVADRPEAPFQPVDPR